MKKSALLIGVSLLFVSCSSTPTTPIVQTPTPAVNISQADLAKHATQADCWTAIRGTVYDITGFFGKHRGGDEKLLALCGTDGTEAFTKKHSGKEKPEATLVSLPKIGKLQ